MTYAVSIVSILGAVQALLMAGLLLFIRADAIRANKYLAAVLGILALTLIIAFLHFTRLILYVPHFFSVTPTFTMLYGPLLYFYVVSLLKGKSPSLGMASLHFVPFIVQVKLMWPFLNMSGKMKGNYLMNIFEDRFLPSFNEEAVARGLHLLVYLGISYFITVRHDGEAKAQQNATGSIRHFWARALVAASLLIWSVYTFLYFSDQNLLNLIMPGLIAVSTYGLSFFGFKYPEIFREVQIRKLEPKYRTSRLTDADKSRYADKLVEILQKERLYAKPDLNVQSLAKRSHISPQKLSQIINEKFNQNFSEFINGFRVEEAKRLLTDPQNRHLTILAIAYEVGFNSKSAFNAAFKKCTNQTPSQFVNDSSSRTA